ncbi:hypothetical protein [Neobacillus soli]|uniref:hypothetical protein n=1 Tax=Neobacillus soli TaxID=220688 RepID=UPI000826405C|nr:hypothetical protein [Neobacillus soli]
MKKLLTVLFGGFIALSLFVATGNTAKAAEPTTAPQTVDENCECHNVTPIFGAERNKIVAKIISSKEYKEVEKNLKKDSFKWQGANSVEVLRFNKTGQIIVGVPFTNNAGVQIMAVFIDGEFGGISPADSE